MIFERINHTPNGKAGIGWFCGVVTLDAGWIDIVPEAEYVVRVTKHKFEVYTRTPLSLNPIGDCGVVEDYFKKSDAWTDLIDRDSHSCRFIHIKTNKRKNVSTYICFGVVNKVFITPNPECGDTWYEFKTMFSTIEPPVNSMGHNSSTLLRLPIWSCPELSNEPIAIEPTTADFLRECDLQKKFILNRLEPMFARKSESKQDDMITYSGL